VAQIGSVIGRNFSYALIRDVARVEDAPLQTALERLAVADLLLVQGVPPESNHRFKHALIQDAAYENLLKSLVRSCIAASRRRCLTNSPPLRPNRNCWHTTSPRPA
jgi:hypothetical protein